MVCVGFLYTVVRSFSLSSLQAGSPYGLFRDLESLLAGYCCRGLPNSLEKEVFIFFDFFGKLDVGVLFVKVVVKSVNFVFVNGGKSVVYLFLQRQFWQFFTLM